MNYPHNINRIRMSLSVCLSVIVLLLNGKRWGHVNGTDRSTIYRHVFLYKKRNFSSRALPGQKADIANHLFFPFFSSFNPTIYKCEWPSGQVDGLDFQCTDVRVGSTPPPPLTIYMDLTSNVRMYIEIHFRRTCSKEEDYYKQYSNISNFWRHKSSDVMHKYGNRDKHSLPKCT